MEYKLNTVDLTSFVNHLNDSFETSFSNEYILCVLNEMLCAKADLLLICLKAYLIINTKRKG